MPSSGPQTPTRALRALWPLVGFLGGVLLTLTAWLLIRQADRERVGALQAAQARSLCGQLQRRMGTLEEVLRGAAGYLGHGQLATRAEFRDYVAGLGFRDHYRGVQGLGFAQLIPLGTLEAHVRRVRAEGFPDYRVVAGGSLGEDPGGASSILYLEPMDARNQRAFGKDMMADPVRREALVRARDTGEPALSGPVVLYQENGSDIQVGTVLYAPVYGQAAETLAGRRAALRGWASCPFRMGDLVQGALGHELGRAEIALYDGPEPDPARLLYASGQGLGWDKALGRSFPVGGRVWTARVLPNAAFFAAAGGKGHWEILLAGLALSLALGSVIVLAQGAEARAWALAEVRLEELRSTEASFRTLFDQAPVGMAIVDTASGRFRTVNPRLAQILGYTPAGLMDQTFQELTHPEHVQADLASVRALAKGEVDEYEEKKRYIHRDGRSVWARLKVARLPRAPGEPARHLAIVEDITEFLRATEALRENDARFRNLVENAVDAIVLMDAEGRILLTNLEASRLTGYTREEFLGMRIHDLSPGMPMDEHAKAWQTLVFGESRTFEGRTRRKDGSSFPVEIHIGLLTPGEPKQILTMARDLSARERLKEIELHARKAESLVLMAGGIAHDFNNLFQAIQSNLEIAEFQAAGDEALTASLRQARCALGKAVGLSWKMLDFAGHIALRVEPLDLGALVARAAPGAELDCRPVPLVMGDAARIDQVVRALVDNAREAGAAHIRLRLGPDPGIEAPGGVWPLPRRPGHGTIRLDVEDDGPGVPPGQLPLICDPFYTTRQPGRGLGLPSAVGILKAHRAGLHLLAGAGSGLVVRVYFDPA